MDSDNDSYHSDNEFYYPDEISCFLNVKRTRSPVLKMATEVPWRTTYETEIKFLKEAKKLLKKVEAAYRQKSLEEAFKPNEVWRLTNEILRSIKSKKWVRCIVPIIIG